MQPVVEKGPGLSEAVREMGVSCGQSPQNTTKKCVNFSFLNFLLFFSLSIWQIIR